jgi:hypothetical protein
MFKEIERIWVDLGHRPSKDDWNSARPKISYNAYRRRFRGWQNACLRFIEHQMRRATAAGVAEQVPTVQAGDTADVVRPLPDRPSGTDLCGAPADRRDPSHALIKKVWKRDGFRCRRCGRSPATHFGVVLEMDHVVPWVQGGRTTLENLQTLCSNCNRSKRDEMPSAGVGA